MSKKGATIFLLMQVFFVVGGIGLFFGLKELKQSRAQDDLPQAEEGTALPPGVAEGYPSAAAGDGGTVSSPPMREDGAQAVPPQGLPGQQAPACDYAQWIGNPADEAAIKATGRPYRILPPGSMMTMDFNPERLNVETDDSGVVIAVNCG